MNKLLPKSKYNTRGFTLIELLTVVAIIAILSIIAITIFTGTQKNARDGARRSEVKAIANALEVGKTTPGYQPLLTTAFASGAIPSVDPQTIPYCISTSGTATPTIIWATCPAGFVAVSATTNTVPTANSTQFKVCSILENSTPPVFCLNSAQ